jgi:hypothetical protein
MLPGTTLQEMGLDDYRVDTFSSDYDDTLLMSLDMILMPMEPSVGSFTGAPFEGPFCNLYFVTV